MKPVATLVAITLLTLAALLGAGPVPVAAAAPHPAQEVADGPLRLELAQLSPRVVTAGGPRDLVVTGTLTNTGELPVRDLVIRVQRGNPLDTAGAVRNALDGSARTDAVTPQFTALPGELAPGQQLPVHLTVPLRGAPETSLALAATGVHELLVNVNGAPGDGARARLAAARVLLPVLSLPPDPSRPDQVPDATTGGATPFALLVPITDAPRRLATVPGEPTLLSDDALAASFAPDGRLGGLVGALARYAPPQSRLRAATCLAIDPELVLTAAMMRDPDGYQVHGPDGTAVAGTGGEAAGQWLDELASIARSGCVVALPYADADLVALTRAGLGELAASAITDGRRVVQDVLQADVVPDVTWPTEGAVDDATLAVAAQAGGRSLLLSADAVEQGRTPVGSGVHPIAGGQRAQFAVLTDPLLTRAASGRPDAAPGDDPGALRGGSAPSVSPAGTGSALATQDVIGALAFRTQVAADAPARGPGPLVLAPPHGWTAGGAATEALLGAIDQLLDVGRIVATDLDDVLAAGPPIGTAALPITYPLQVGGREVPSGALDTVRDTAADIDDLASAAVPDGDGVRPEAVFTPLRRALLSSASGAWRTRPEAAEAAAEALAARVSELRASVRVLEPPGPYSLGTSDAPLLITVANGLPVTVRVGVQILPSSGLRVAPIEPQDVPPLGRRQVRVNAEVTRSGQFSVQAAVRTPGGELLGPPSRLRVRSTAYGTITVWLTASAGILLVVLAGRRVVRRIRGEPSSRPPGPVPPPPDLPEVPERPATRDPSPRRTGDPFPDPLAVTDRLPPVRPHRDGPPRPPGPPRVPSP